MRIITVAPPYVDYGEYKGSVLKWCNDHDYAIQFDWSIGSVGEGRSYYWQFNESEKELLMFTLVFPTTYIGEIK